MKIEQRFPIQLLINALIELNEQCLESEEFNLKVAKLDIFAKDIETTINILVDFRDLESR